MSAIAGLSRNPIRLILIGAAVLFSLGIGLRQSLGLFLTPVTRDLALTASSFHPCCRDPEYRLGCIAGAGRSVS
jgi:hypothetical protein